MMKAGVPLLQSFDIIGEGVDNPNMRKLVDDIKQHVAAGNSFAAAPAFHASGGSYGRRRLHIALHTEGLPAGRSKVRRLMCVHGLRRSWKR